MRGQQLGGTRKLNKHWQSGTPGEKIVRLTGLVWPIVGFDLSGYTSGSYNPIDPTPYRHRNSFGKSDNDNIVAAQLYKLWGTNTPIIKETDDDIIVGNWQLQHGPSLWGKWFVSYTAGARIDNVHVWHYGKFRGDPYWCYYSMEYKGWPLSSFSGATKFNAVTAYAKDKYADGRITYDDMENQNGILRNTGVTFGASGTWWGNNPFEGNSYYIEDAYNGKTIKVLIPYYEVIAMPIKHCAMSRLDSDYVRTVIFGNNINLEVSNDITCVGNDFDRNQMIPVITESWETELLSTHDNATFMGKQADNNTYMTSAATREGGIVGAICGQKKDFFPGDKVWNLAMFPHSINDPTGQYNRYTRGPSTMDTMYAGNYQGEDMFYFWRLDHLECETFALSNRVVPFEIHLA